MNLYLLSQHDNRGYDTYDAVVVAAVSEDDARTIRPDSWDGDSEYLSHSWARSNDLVKVELIGNAVEGTERGIILSSFNAG